MKLKQVLINILSNATKFTDAPGSVDMTVEKTATRAIRALDRPDAQTIPIIALTANAFDEDVQRSLQTGMNAHLSKPVDPEHLYQTLEELIWEAQEEQ